MKIAISGAQSTGKTTLLNELKKNELFKNFEFSQEVTRCIKDKGLPINEDGTDYTQALIMFEHFTRLRNRKDVIYDRCSLDGLVYSKYLNILNKIQYTTLLYVEFLFRNTIQEYDLIYYLEPEIPIEDDGVRSVNTEFRDSIVGIFETMITIHKIPVIRLTGTVEERIKKIEESINEYRNR